MEQIYVTGHRNPDTDSVVSAMAYAALRSALGERQYVAARLGHCSDETKEGHLPQGGVRNGLHVKPGDVSGGEHPPQSSFIVGDAIPVGRVARKEDLQFFHLTDYIDDVREVVLQSRYRSQSRQFSGGHQSPFLVHTRHNGTGAAYGLRTCSSFTSPTTSTTCGKWCCKAATGAILCWTAARRWWARMSSGNSA